MKMIIILIQAAWHTRPATHRKDPAMSLTVPAAERHFGVRLAFQNCHRAAVFRPEATRALAEFTTARAGVIRRLVVSL